MDSFINFALVIPQAYTLYSGKIMGFGIKVKANHIKENDIVIGICNNSSIPS